jgi:hypothetical protein
MEEVLKLFHETRQWRLYHRSKGQMIEAASCVVREKALLDALIVLGYPLSKIKQLEKL